MKSIKPGRGPSFMGGIAGIAGTLFALLWTIFAFKMGAPFMFPLFGIVFMVLMDSQEEVDPLNERFGSIGEADDVHIKTLRGADRETETAYCPYCGAKVDRDFEFCAKCIYLCLGFRF